ncbi:MAG: DUF547 domain-containing protein [Nitrospinales bacterium]
MFCALVWALPASAATFDFSAWDAMLKKYVAPKTISGIPLNAVAYREIKDDPEFRKLIAQLAKFPPERLETREEELSFWINVYNIMAVKMVVDHYPVRSIRVVGSLLEEVEGLLEKMGKLAPKAKQLLLQLEGFAPKVWNMPVGFVGGREQTLNAIEHEILRKMGEPRIHVAIVCASVSCPDILRDAYTPESLDSQLTGQMKHFLQNPGKGMRIDRENGRLYLSSLFKWFGDDFKSHGGVLSFIANYVSPEQQKLLQSRKWEIVYMDYDWSLNEL